MNLCLVAKQRPTSFLPSISLSWIVTQRAIPSRDCQVAPRVPCFRMVIGDRRWFSRRLRWLDSGVRAPLAAHNMLKVFLKCAINLFFCL